VTTPTDAIAFAKWLRDEGIDLGSWFADTPEELYEEFQKTYKVPGTVKRMLAYSPRTQTNASSEFDWQPDEMLGAAPAAANLVTSLVANRTTGRWHAPVLDLDLPATLVPSTTEGHFHLYIDREVPESSYFRLLDTLADCGIIEKGYASASKRRGFSAVRVPWVKKPGASS
jgi:hypothetical protein